MHVGEQEGSYVYALEEKELRCCLFCLFADCMFVSVFATLQVDTISSSKGFTFHSLHASASGRRIHYVCIRFEVNMQHTLESLHI